jgi:glucose-6-phosphate isomerase
VDAWSSLLDLPGGAIRFDWSKTHLDAAHGAAFVALADAVFRAKRGAMFAGEASTLPKAARWNIPPSAGWAARTAVEEAALHLRMKGLVEAIHAGALGEVRHLIHIGIGGSALGPALALDALAAMGRWSTSMSSPTSMAARWKAAFRLRSGHHADRRRLQDLHHHRDHDQRRSALAWLRDGGVDDPYGRVVALTAYPDKAVEWGVDETRVLPFAESVGGRYSLWSSIGFPVALALGWDDFAEMLDGAAAMDRHFLETDGAGQPAAARGLCRPVLRAACAAARPAPVFAYDERLRLLPSYLQQLEMESNGKAVRPTGAGGRADRADHLGRGGHRCAARGVPAAPPGHAPGAGRFHRRDRSRDELDPAHHRNPAVPTALRKARR